VQEKKREKAMKKRWYLFNNSMKHGTRSSQEFAVEAKWKKVSVVCFFVMMKWHYASELAI